MLSPGDSAPAFTLPDQSGKQWALKNARGSMVVLYFYPKDNSPGCTTEACNFRDAYAELRNIGATVVGISPDTVESHEEFAATYALPITLLSDPAKKVIQEYGAWGKKVQYGKEYDGVIRSTILIDGKGIVRKVYATVSPDEHITEVLADIRGMATA